MHAYTFLHSNTVMYNLASACIFCDNNVTLDIKSFSLWIQSCPPENLVGNGSFPIPDAAAAAYVPTWALKNLYADATFSLEVALRGTYFYNSYIIVLLTDYLLSCYHGGRLVIHTNTDPHSRWAHSLVLFRCFLSLPPGLLGRSPAPYPFNILSPHTK